MVSYFDDLSVFHADTCKPLSAAAAAGDMEMRALARGTYPGERLPANEMRELKTVGYWDAPRDQAFPLDVTTEYFRVINEVVSDHLDPKSAGGELQKFIAARK